MALAVGNLANDIKGIKLQPARQVAALRVAHKQLLRAVEKQLGRIVDKGLVLHQRRHGKGRVDAAAELLVEVVVDGAEEAGQGTAFDDGLLDDVKVGLDGELEMLVLRLLLDIWMKRNSVL